MAWIEWRKSKKATRYFLRDRIGGEKLTIIEDLGIWKKIADDLRIKYEKAVAQGFTFVPPIVVGDIQAFLEARAEGLDTPSTSRRLLVGEMCDLYLKHFGPSLKGGTNEHYKSPYYILKLRLEQLKRTPAEVLDNGQTLRTWAQMYADQIHLYHVRALLGHWRTIGTRMRNLGAYGAMFKAFEKWNKTGNVLPYLVRLPKYNPFSAWRCEMKPSEKKEYADTRVLTKQEWDDFKIHLPIRARQICEIALRRFLRSADIEKLSGRSEKDSHLRGFQEKTGDPFIVPLIVGHPAKYDFTNFRRDFESAQFKAGMQYPADHPLHFSFKDLRRTGATWAYKKTKNLVAISKMLGHKKISTTIRYLNIDETDLYAIAKAVDAIADAKSQSKSHGHRLGKRPKNTILSIQTGPTGNIGNGV